MARATPKQSHIFLSCGEASGDRYGAALVSALHDLRPDARITALGGQALALAGAEIVANCEDIAVMGLTDVVTHLAPILRTRRRLWRHLRDGGVDLVVPIDFPGFNLMLARQARRRQIPVFYVVPPQLWAWGGWRLRALRRHVDRLGTILPFEPEWFGQRGVATVHLGHPLLEDYGGFPLNASCRAREQRLEDPQQPITLGLLPGSRRQEIERLLPEMLVAAGIVQSWCGRRRLRVIVSKACGPQGRRLVELVNGKAKISEQPLPLLLPQLDLALVCSGTASLEAALAGVPQALVYRTSRFNHALARRLVHVPFIGLANLILDRRLVPEHIQAQADPLYLANSLLRILNLPNQRQEYYRGCKELRRRCGGAGAWKRAARVIDEMLPARQEV